MSLQQVSGQYGVYMIGHPPAGNTASGGAGSGTIGAGASSVDQNLPKGVFFEPVQVGFLGTKDAVVITGGLKPGDKILLGEGRFMGPSSSATSGN